MGCAVDVVPTRDEENGVSIGATVQTLRQEFPAARLLEKGNRIKRVYGTAMTKASTAKEAAERFINEHVRSFGAKPEQLEIIKPKDVAYELKEAPEALGLIYDKDTGKSKFYLYRYRQVYEGIPVFRAELRLTVSNSDENPVVLAGSSLHNLSKFSKKDTPKEIFIDKIKSLAAIRSNTDFQGSTIDKTPILDIFSEPELVIYAGYDGEEVEPRLAINYEAGSFEPLGNWLFVADAKTGDVLFTESMVNYADLTGRVTLHHSNSFFENGDSIECSSRTPFPQSTVGTEVSIVGGTTVFVDGRSRFTIPYSGTSPVDVVATLKGKWFDVYNASGDDYQQIKTVTPGVDGTFVLGETETDDVQYLAQANPQAFFPFFLDVVSALSPGYFTLLSGLRDFPIYVNSTSSSLCPGNAVYATFTIFGIKFSWITVCDSGIKNGITYSNYSFSDVLLHEFTHHLVSIAGSGQGSYGEGMGDTVASLFHNDPDLAKGYILNDCETPMRSAENNCQYSATHCSNCISDSNPDPKEIHNCGNLLSGIMWDISEAGLGWGNTLYLALNSILMHEGESIDQSIAVDLLTLDDDDNNLDNGTPHSDEICTGFVRHGIECPIESFGEWTSWLDRDNPGGSGDWEDLASFIAAGKVCEHPVGIQGRKHGTSTPWFDTGEVITATPEEGLVCRNADQPDGKCYDYDVRFFCTEPW